MINPDRHIEVMGIVNLTDDSYFSPSRNLKDGRLDVNEVITRVIGMVADGAEVIDFGACSSRPGAVPLSWEEEWRRLGPVVASFLENVPDVRFSIDTWHSQVVSRIYEMSVGAVGADAARKLMIVNDISAGEDDADMLPLVGGLKLKYIAMHKRGTSEDMQNLCGYDDVVSEVKAYFEDFAGKAEAYGISDWVLDPGFGFAKTLEQNYQLLNGLSEFSGCGQSAVLAGVSRKSMIYRYLNITPEESLPATQVLHLKALQGGADILRVHDVAEAVRTAALYKVLR